LNYPKTLDLKWPQPTPKGWNNRKNVGQFIWDVINPNPQRWREGIKFNHFLLTQHTSDRARTKRVMSSLGSMYFRFLQDYPRAAYWIEKAGYRPTDGQALIVAECYWRMGYEPKAREILNQRTLRIGMIKLWGDMGETAKAVQVAESYVRAGGSMHHAYLAAGDACRVAGQFNKALPYYKKVASTPPKDPKDNRLKQVRSRAKASAEAVELFELCDVAKVPDGSYRSQSIGYRGAVHIQVDVANGKITKVAVTQHQEKQFYSAIRDATEQIVAKQGVRGVDATSRATITAEAIINATAKALAGARSGR
jgi:uncharacterized protein with FMN-binding domain